MNFQGIYDRLESIGAPGLVEANEPRPKDPENKKDKGRYGDPYVIVEAPRLTEFLTVCRDDEVLRFEMLADLCGVDPGDEDEGHLWVVVQLLSTVHRHRFQIKTRVPKARPELPTSSSVYRSAQWHEREASEMYGIVFTGHPDPRNILLPDDWEGFPLRKDYVFPKEYHGISCE